MILTDSELDDLIAMETRATARPWRESMSGYSVKSHDPDVPIVTTVKNGVQATEKQLMQFAENAALIAAARNALSSLLAEVKAARRLIEAARKMGHQGKCGAIFGGSCDCVMDAIPEYDALAKREEGK